MDTPDFLSGELVTPLKDVYSLKKEE